MEEDWIYYSADASDLIAELSRLPKGSRVECNAVGNLKVLDPKGEYVGWISVRNICEFESTEEEGEL